MYLKIIHFRTDHKSSISLYPIWVHLNIYSYDYFYIKTGKCIYYVNIININGIKRFVYRIRKFDTAIEKVYMRLSVYNTFKSYEIKFG